MLQYRIHTPHTVAGFLGVLNRHDRLQHGAPEHRGGVVIRVGLGDFLVPSGFLHPQFQLGLVGVKANGSGSIRAAYTLFANFQPLITLHVLGADQTQRTIRHSRRLQIMSFHNALQFL